MKPQKIPPPRLAPRDPAAHKGDSGRLLVVAGAVGTSGAARLCARGALGAGAGLLVVAVPKPVRAEVAAEDPAFMTAGLRSTLAGTLAYPAAPEVLARAASADAVAIGPGLGVHEECLACVRHVLAHVAVAAVVDADALNAVASGGVPAAAGPRVWTPHPGEAARLLGADDAAIGRDRVGAARALWDRLRGVVVLKGAGTLVTDGSDVFENTTGHAGLATGGSGDVLTGMIGAFLASGMPPLQAATSAVYLHGRAADDLLPRTGTRALTMRAFLRAIPRAVARAEASVSRRPAAGRRGSRG